MLMPRPTKCRRVGFVPQVTHFKPADIPLRCLDSVSLSIEELEAIRLKDYQGLQQEECAVLMEVSRPTFRRVLSSARGKIADALITGKGIRIEGGTFEMAGNRFAWGREETDQDMAPEEWSDEEMPVCRRCRRRDVDIPAGGRGGWQCRRGHRWEIQSGDGIDVSEGE